MLDKICPRCKTGFKTERPEKVYCSEKCQRRAGEARRRKSLRATNPEYRAKQNAKKNLLDSKCKELRAKKERERRAKNRSQRFCVDCGSVLPLYHRKRCGKCNKRVNKNCLGCGKELGYREKKWCRLCSTQRTKEQNSRYTGKYLKTPKGRELVRHAVHKRNARKRNLPNTFSRSEWEEALEYFEYRCAYCMQPLSKTHQDHFIPVAKGGGYEKKNIVPSCPKCNQKKNRSTPLEWLVMQSKGLVTYARIQNYLEPKRDFLLVPSRIRAVNESNYYVGQHLTQ